MFNVRRCVAFSFHASWYIAYYLIMLLSMNKISSSSSKVRLCVDFRHLKKYCLREHYFSPSVLDVVQSIKANDAHLFSSFDAWKGYHQIELAEESKHLTTFLTPFGHFRHERAPFGIDSISEHYNRRMFEELYDLPNTKKIVDDNIVYSSNSLAQHTACKEISNPMSRSRYSLTAQ